MPEMSRGRNGETNVCLDTLQDAVLSADSSAVRSVLDQWRGSTDLHDTIQTIGGELLRVISCLPPNSEDRLDLVYMLTDSGSEVNHADQWGTTPLHLAARRGDSEMCEVLLQCGADMYAECNALSLYEEILQAANGKPSFRCVQQCHPTTSRCHIYSNVMTESTSACAWGEDPEAPSLERTANSGSLDMLLYEHEQETGGCVPCARRVMQSLDTYAPGMWRAVEEERTEDLRRLLSLWCKTDLVRDGISLRQAAVETRNDLVMGMILGAIPTMRVVHHVLANDITSVADFLSSDIRPRVNLDVRHLGHRAAPLLYFPLRRGRSKMVQTLCAHGANPCAMLQDEDGRDMPVIFVTLIEVSSSAGELVQAMLPRSNQVAMEDDPTVIQNLPFAQKAVVPTIPLPHSSALIPTAINHPKPAYTVPRCVNLSLVTYRGSTLLHVAVRSGLGPETISSILEAGGPKLLCSRTCQNETARDMAIRLHRRDLIEALDEVVYKWICDPLEYSGYREALVAGGFEPIHVPDALSSVCSEDVVRFLGTVESVQDAMHSVAVAASEGDVDTLGNMRFQYNCQIDLALEGRIKGDGMPALHIAVLYSCAEVVAAILTPERTVPLDTIRDQYQRTALHYAYALRDTESSLAIRSHLLDSGCSEHTLDMDGREVLDFRDARGSPLLEELLHYLRERDYDSAAEVDIWDPDAMRRHSDTQRQMRFRAYQESGTHHNHHSHGHWLSQKSEVHENKFDFDDDDEDYMEDDDDDEEEEELSQQNSYWCTIL